jgi:hypothetical protein
MDGSAPLRITVSAVSLSVDEHVATDPVLSHEAKRHWRNHYDLARTYPVLPADLDQVVREIAANMMRHGISAEISIPAAKRVVEMGADQAPPVGAQSGNDDAEIA